VDFARGLVRQTRGRIDAPAVCLVCSDFAGRLAALLLLWLLASTSDGGRVK